MAVSLAVILSTFAIIFVAELPDKTALATLVLATRHRARDVVLGAGLAFLVQTLVGVAAGSVLTLLPAQPIRIASGLGFLVFAVLSFRRQEEDAAKDAAASRHPAWLTAFLVVFAAEWGDLTQLATAALVAENHQPLSVGIGAVLALWAVTLLAAMGGAHAARYIKPVLLNRIGGVLFAAIGLFIIASAVF